MLALDHGMESPANKLSKTRSKSKLKERQGKIMERKKQRIKSNALMNIEEDNYERLGQ